MTDTNADGREDEPNVYKSNKRLRDPVVLHSFSLPASHSVLSTMTNYVDSFYRNMAFAETLLSPMNQSLKGSVKHPNILKRVLTLWPIWYCGSWVLFLSILIFTQNAGLEVTQIFPSRNYPEIQVIFNVSYFFKIISEQIYVVMSVMQMVVKRINGEVQVERIHELLKWCEDIYTTKYKPEYQRIVNEIFKTTNLLIYLCIR